MSDDGLIDCPQCEHWEGETSPVQGCGLCDGTGRCQTFEAMHGYSWEGSNNNGETNIELCVAAIEEYGNCTLGQMVHLAPNRHAQNPFTPEQVEKAIADPRVKEIMEGVN